MPKINIPEDYKPGFKELLTLSNTQREQLSAFFSKTSAKTQYENMAEQISAEISIEQSSALEIAKSIDSLFFAKESGSLNSEDLINGITEFLQTSDDNLNSDNLISVNELIRKLFYKESKYYVTNKAQSLTSQREKLFLKSRILSDIRPVFNEEEDCQIEAEVIIHTLKIDYQKGGYNKTIYLALDLSDLSDLKLQIERAEKKDAFIRKNIGKLNDTIVDPY